MLKKSLVDTAYEIMTERYDSGDKNPVAFLELCQGICENLGLSEEAFARLVSRFYTDMTLDGRFVLKENNTWSLREHELYKNVHIDMNDVYSEDDLPDTRKKKKEKTDIFDDIDDIDDSEDLEDIDDSDDRDDYEDEEVDDDPYATDEEDEDELLVGDEDEDSDDND